MIRPDEEKRIEDLVIGDDRERFKIDKVELQQLNKLKQQAGMESLKNIPKMLAEKNGHLNLLHKDRNYQREIAIKLYESARYVKFLKTGDYWIQDNNRHLIFSESSLSYLENKSQQTYQYDGFMFKFKKWLYQGQFRVIKNRIVFSKGELMQMNEKKDWIFLKGEWSNGNFINGVKEIYEGKVSMETLKQSYTGTLVEGKYDGEGKLAIRNKNGHFDRLHGIFQFGKLIESKSDNPNTNSGSGVQNFS